MSQQQRRFRANRGGNAPGHIRAALVECFDYEVEPWFEALNDEENEVVFFSQSMQERWNKMSPRQRGLWVIGQLWNCTDILPGVMCWELDLPPGSTYAVAVRKLRNEMDDQPLAASG